jgi:hypothetical protein
VVLLVRHALRGRSIIDKDLTDVNTLEEMVRKVVSRHARIRNIAMIRGHRVVADI